MRTSITLKEIKNIYALHGADMSEKDFIESMEQCNEQADVVYSNIHGNPVSPRSAAQWAHFFALQTAQEQLSDCHATARFHVDAYGE